MDAMKLGNDSSFFTSARRGAGNTTVTSPKLKSLKEDTYNLSEGLTFLDPNADYTKQGELHMQKLREEIRKRELEEALNSKNMITADGKVAKQDIMEMTPAEKQEFLARKKIE
jgi:hypothetical protein